ncbi:MAG TPA: L-glyceraldehyde 3-phosphate reductase [Opitutales bacterium]|nr:L-glyceraldehyde 3-phosphate reductase [Opitutales bacterium]
MAFLPSDSRYADGTLYSRCGKSGLMLPRVSLGLWHNFGDAADLASAREIVLGAFDRGITHFDLANNYGPPPGAAERNFGSLVASDLKPWRDELVISTKAGYGMWPGPYGDWGSRKYLLSSLDQSLKRLGLDYVDIFYHHRPDPATPIAETMGALASAVQSGKALYVGISNYNAAQTREALDALSATGVRCLIHQPRYNMLDRRVERDGLLPSLEAAGLGCIAFSPLAQGLLSERYLSGIPEDSRAHRDGRFLREDDITPARVEILRALAAIAKRRGQSLAQMALAWVLRNAAVTSVLIGASRLAQIDDNLGAIRNTAFSAEELTGIDALLARFNAAA